MDGPINFNLDQIRTQLKTIFKENNLNSENLSFLTKSNDISVQLDHLSILALTPSLTVPILTVVDDLFLEIAARWIDNDDNITNKLIALSKSISILPSLSQMIDYYLNKIGSQNIENLFNSQSSDLDRLLLSFYRLISHEKSFIQYIDNKILYSILESSTSQSTKYLSLLILSIYLQISESCFNEWLNNHLQVDKEIIGEYDESTVDLLFLPLLEAKRISSAINIIRKQAAVAPENSTPSHPFQSNRFISNIGGTLVPNFHASTHSSTEFVSTPTIQKSLKSMANAIVSSEPILLYGPEGSGKTFLVDETAKHLSAYDSMVRIHLGDQTDAKILVGTYSTGEKPGSFEWRAGVLTIAVREGRWVLIEDIDKAPNEILSLLLPLLEKRELLIPSRSEVIKAKRGFQLFATMKSINSRSGVQLSPDLIGKRFWTQIKVNSPSQDELIMIIKARFPLLQNLATTFVQVYSNLSNHFTLPRFMSLCKSSQRQISPRDAIKWAKRVNHMLIQQNITSPNQPLPSNVYDNIFAEAFDCFAGFISTFEGREYLANIIGESLEISSNRVNLFLTKHIPSMNENISTFTIGRGSMIKSKSVSKSKSRILSAQRSKFALTGHSLRLIEQVGVATSMSEPILLVGETGTGKTTVVQYLANVLNKNITIINVSQQTETGDLLGGYKPVDSKMIAMPIKEKFDLLFENTFSAKKNERFLAVLTKSFVKSHWGNTIKLWREAYRMADELLTKDSSDNETATEKPKKKRRIDSSTKEILLPQWKEFLADVNNFEIQAKQVENSFFFSFVEGLLVQAVKRGDWVLLDEINLASPDTLESIADLLIENPSITLSEKGDAGSIKAHPDFRLFACMNPATDIGKRDLPVGLRSRFTELYVTSPDRDIADLLAIIDKYIGHLSMSDQWIGNDVAELYLEAKSLSEQNKIVDGANQKPHFSIRTLSRTLVYSASISHIYGLRRALYEGFCMSFLTLLDKPSEDILLPIISKYTINRLKNVKSVLSQIPPAPQDGHQYVQFKHYWLRQGSLPPQEEANYIITPFVEKNLLSLTRATAGRLFPVLIQGPTSSGKTSMIKYLANKSGHKFVRINNHEHTDLQEYLGSYVSDDRGQLKFQEGVLVEAVRNGYWIVLDELNLAPTDVLEALNRLLDDNRELLIPETQEVVKPHPDFMLFATQNPPGLYGGRKLLSRAFRNRFLELHFDDIPEDELEIILRDRCQIAPSYAKKIVDVYRQLSVERQSTRLFEQKNSFATLRDLFRWAQREAVGYEQLALNGYILLGERVRKPEERIIVQKTIEKVMRVKLDIDDSYNNLLPQDIVNSNNTIVWTKGMKRLLVLVWEAIQNNEPVLLVGETGCGKTTICQILSDSIKKELHIVNAHQNTETGDIIGAQRPVRNRGDLQKELAEEIRKVLLENNNTSSDVDDADLDGLKDMYKSVNPTAVTEESRNKIQHLLNRLQILFEWHDGTLIQALKQGDFFLLDEISLADDSVLERLNSVLEPERTLLLSEKGSQDVQIVAKQGFQFLSTMNPGGDYGKKELSPALRNRFTEIWVPSMEDFDDVLLIAQSKLNGNVKHFAKCIIQFGQWFGQRYGNGDASSGIISLRDILAWINFINALSESISPELSVFHGACMVFIDSVGTNNSAALTQSIDILEQHRTKCVEKLSKLIGSDFTSVYRENTSVSINAAQLQVGPFILPRDSTAKDASFNLQAPTTAMNALRVIRAMQAHKPILLEGSPGVGKTSLITAIADVVGRPLTRINLSEQTDLIDLFGSDSPAEGSSAGEFVWKDAPFLRAMQRGEWVLLDEMNLASQSVLEGLNACLDHRGEAYIPELDKTFTCGKGFTVFAAQNPHYQGGGRKGLPKSFINRFSVVYVDTLTLPDLHQISSYIFPQLESALTEKLIKFVVELDNQVSVKRSFGQLGSPFEFNLRDTMRWLGLVNNSKGISSQSEPFDFFNIIIGQRFRQKSDREAALKLYEEYFGPVTEKDEYLQVSHKFLQSGHSLIRRDEDFESGFENILFLQCNNQALESMITCVEKAWPVILVGPTNSGKTSLIRGLANSLGKNLKEFPMNGDIDSTDLLGGFDQVDIAHKASQIFEQIHELCVGTISFILKHSVSSEWKTLLFNLSLLFDNVSGSREFEVNHLYNVRQALSKVPMFNEEFGKKIDKLVNAIDGLIRQSGENQVARFQWLDGTLVKAVEEGHWLILDNANLCNPSVLDRLNSLLEPNGCLIVNECSLENGEPRMIRPHKDFRLFLTIDPRYGELSRAMRNRGVEVYLEDLKFRASDFDKHLLEVSSELEGVNESEPLETALNGLNLSNEVIESFVSKHLTSSNAYLRPFALVEDAVNSCSNLDCFAEAIINFLPKSTLLLVKRWMTVLHNSGLFSENSKTVSTLLFEKLQFINESGYISALQSFYSLALSNAGEENSEFCKLFPFNPLTDTSVSRFASISHAQNAHLVLILLQHLYFVYQTIELVEKNAQTLRPSEMTYLAKSAAASMGKAFKQTPKVMVFPVVSGIARFISSYLKIFFENGGQKDTLIIVRDLLFTCSDLIELTNNSQTDESKLHIYRDILDNWLSSNSSSSEFTSIIPELTVVINSFGSQLDLTTGQSMELIWQRYKPELPVSEVGWTNYKTIIDLCNRFDNIVKELFTDSSANVNVLRESLIESIIAISRNSSGLENLLNQLEIGIIELENITSRFHDHRVHLFNNTFQNLSVIIELVVSSKNGNPFNILQDMSNFSLLSTTHLASYKRVALQSPYPPVLDSLVNDETHLNLNSFLNGNAILRNILSDQSALQNAPAGQFGQAFNDFKVLSQFLLANVNVLTEDKLQPLATILRQRIQQCQSLHEDTEISIIENFNIIEERYFLPAIKLLDEVSPKSVGTAWVLYAVAMIVLYVPDLSYDPAIHQHVEFERNATRREAYENGLEAVKLVRQIFVGHKPSAVERALIELEPRVDNSEFNTFRPKDSQLEAIHREWTSLIETATGPEVVERLLRSSSDEIELWHINCSRFISRLQENHPYYYDISSILTGFIKSLQLGFGVIASDSIKEKNPLPWLFDPISLISPSYLYEVFEKSNKSLIKDTNDVTLENLYLYAFKCAVFNIKKTSSERGSDSSYSLIDLILKTFYYKWSLDKMRQKEEEIANSSIFKDNSEEEVDEDFKRIFPDYEDVMEVEDKKSVSSILLRSQEIMDIHKSLFNDGVDYDLSSIILDGVEVTRKALQQTEPNTEGTSSIGNILSGLIYSLSTNINKVFGDNSSKALNFYHDSRQQETDAVSDLAKGIRNRMKQLLERWPEHSTLQNINYSCEELLAYPSSTPIARFLQKLEQVLTFLHEWEAYASKEVSVSKFIDQAVNLIISWRKLELSTWAGLLKSEEDAAEKTASQWWFYLYENLIDIPMRSESGDSIDISDLVHTLSVFVSQASYGQFTTILSLLDTFANHAESLSVDEPKMTSIAGALSNVSSFYHLYASQVETDIANIKSSLKKEMNDLILLASWKDTNISALKESARRSHHKLYKVVRKYRSFLNGKITPIVDKPSKSIPSTLNPIPADPKIDSMALLSIKPHIELCEKYEFWTSRPVRLRDIDGTINYLQSIVSKINLKEVASLEPVAISAVEDSDRLRKATPSTITEENKKTISSLKMEKSKTLTSTLKELRQSGLKYTVKTEITRAQGKIAQILASTGSLAKIDTGKGDEYFFKILEFLPRIRFAILNNETDVPGNDLQRASAIGENALAVILSQRKSLNNLLQFTSDLESVESTVVKVASMYSSGDRIMPIGNLSEECQEISFILHWAPEIVKLAANVWSSSVSLGKFSDDGLLTKILNNFSNVISDLNREVLQYDVLYDNEIRTEKLNSIINNIRASINQLKNSVIQLRDSNSKYGLVSGLLLKWVNSVESSCEVNGNSATSSGSTQLADLNTSVCDLSDSILVVTQNILKVWQELVDISEEEDNWFTDTQSRLIKIAKSLHTESIMKKISDCLGMVVSIGSTSKESSNEAIVTFSTSLPFIQEYMKLHKRVRHLTASNYSVTSKASYLLLSCLSSLSTNGFCTPQEESGEGDSGATKEGTGLGDGSGAKDHSEDIEDDEDLTEHAQRDNEDQDDEEDDKEGEDNAKEIEGDMAGDIEDASDQEKEDDEEDNDDEEDEELDDEVGDIDNLDPNAIDEKMWDEKGDDNKKEKDSENVPEGNSDEMQGQDDEQDVDEKKNEQNNEGNEEGEEEEKENDDDGDDEEDVGEQEDNVKQDNEELESQVPEADTLELPEDMNLDNEEGEGEEDAENDDGMDDDGMDDDDVENGDLEEDMTESNAKENEELDAKDDEEEEGENDGDDNDEGESNLMQVDEEPGENENDNNEDEEQSELPEAEVKDEGDSKNSAEEMQVDTEGLQGPDVADDENTNADESTTSKQESSAKGEGADIEQTDEQNNMDDGGGKSSLKPKEEDQDAKKDEDSGKTEDEAVKEANDSIQKLGDAMKEFYRRRQEIKKPSSDAKEKPEDSANVRPDEFEHIDGEDTSRDTQALGEANTDQKQSIDENMAIDDDEDVEIDEMPEKDIDTNEPIQDGDENEREDDNGADIQDASSKITSMVGERAQNNADDWVSANDDSRKEKDYNEEDIEVIGSNINDDGEQQARSLDEARVLWKKYDSSTQELALSLCEQLRLILEPTLATKLRGDFKTGKRLNMKRIIPYIASQFKKDKIWMRRTKPTKRQFQIMIAVDDSKSMSESQSVDLAFETIALVSKALTLLEAGQLAITRFGDNARLLHGFEKPFSSESGAEVLQWFGFEQQRTDVQKLLGSSLQLFETAKYTAHQDLWQLEIIISDGICEDHEALRRLVRRAQEERIMLVFVIVDAINKSGSILDMNQVKYQEDSEGNMKLKMEKYLDTFPFDFYVIVRDIRELPGVLSSVLRQYFAEVAEH